MNRTGPAVPRRRLRARAATAALTLAATAAGSAAALPAVAQAHVTVQPRTAPAGAYTVLDVRVPNERDDEATTKIDLKLLPGFITASFQPVPGWDVRVIRERLSRPIQTENGPISEQISEIVWSGGAIPPGAFQDFPISVQVPARAGDTLTFKALQTYAGGEVVRWIGAPDSETPAAQVAVVAADTAAAAPSQSDDDGASKGLAYAGLAAGIVGLLLGAAALLVATRRRGGAPLA